MFTCPACQKTHEETKFYCNECNEFYCSLECLKYQNFPEYNVLYTYKSTFKWLVNSGWPFASGVKYYMHDMTDLTFSCCNTCYCAKCHSHLIGSPRRENILFCERCKKLFHNDCNTDLKNGSSSCMCKLCVGTTLGIKYIICKKCHEKCNIRQLNLSDLNDVNQFISFDSPEWENLIYEKRLNSTNGGQDILFDFSDCKKYRGIVDDTIPLDEDNVLIECDCEMCKNIKCPTTLFRLMYSCPELLDATGWDDGLDIGPIVGLGLFACHRRNDCNCKICQFWAEESEEYKKDSEEEDSSEESSEEY